MGTPYYQTIPPLTTEQLHPLPPNVSIICTLRLHRFAMGCAQIYCSICGAPVLEADSWPPEDRETANWLADLVLLTTVYEEEDGGHIRLDKYWPCEFRSGGSFGLGPNAAPDGARTVVQFAAKYNLNGTFRVAQGQTVTSLCITPKPFEQCGPIYLPVHRACLEIAARFIHTSQLSQRDTGTSDASFIISVLQLWELLYRRLSGIRDNGDWMLPETHDYLGAGICRGIDWEPENDAEYGALRCPFPPTR